MVRAVREEVEREGAGAMSAAAGADAGSVAGAQSAQQRDRLTCGLRLARRCGLLPIHDVYKVFAGRPPPATMTALIQILLASDVEAARLRTAAREGSGKEKQLGGSNQGGPAALQARTTAMLAAVREGGDGEFARIASVYHSIVHHMLGRYGSGLEEDERLLALGTAAVTVLPPRMYAAILARKPEKEALLSLRKFVGGKGAIRRSLLIGAETIVTGYAQSKVVTGTRWGDSHVEMTEGRSADDRSTTEQFCFGFKL